jgi:hypothetical protein
VEYKQHIEIKKMQLKVINSLFSGWEKSSSYDKCLAGPGKIEFWNNY